MNNFIPLFDLKSQYESIKPEIDVAVTRVLSSGHYILGDEVSDFELAIEEYLGVYYAVGVASGTDALILALRAFDIGPGDEVIVPAFSFWATASAILHVGATPVFVDVEIKDFNISPARIIPQITSKTRAIIPVHLYGDPANMNAIKEIAKGHGLYIIEDAAQAFGAQVPNMGYAGTIGWAGCFSFFPTKPLGCAGDGGMVVTNDDEIYQRIIRLRSHGWTRKYEPERLGYNSRLDALQAAILRAKLPHVSKWTTRRKLIAEFYSSYFSYKNISPFEGIHQDVWNSARHLFVLDIKNRDKVAANLKTKGIETGVYYPVPLFRCKPVYKPEYDHNFPVADYASHHALAIPCYAELSDAQITLIAESVLEAVKNGI